MFIALTADAKQCADVLYMVSLHGNKTLERTTSRPDVFCKKDVLKNFAKFTAKHLYWSLFSIKVAGLRPANLLKNRLRHSCFPVDFPTFLRLAF